MSAIHFYIFFSSRRRHTRLVSDWSSDVCSSDLQLHEFPLEERRRVEREGVAALVLEVALHAHRAEQRSEERRVGKECRYGWWPYQIKRRIEVFIIGHR